MNLIFELQSKANLDLKSLIKDPVPPLVGNHYPKIRDLPTPETYFFLSLSREHPSLTIPQSLHPHKLRVEIVGFKERVCISLLNSMLVSSMEPISAGGCFSKKFQAEELGLSASHTEVSGAAYVFVRFSIEEPDPFSQREIMELLKKPKNEATVLVAQ